MIEQTAYQTQTNQLTKDLIAHGWGEMTFRVTSLKDNTVKIEILCGRSYVYFIKKEVKLEY